MRILLDECVDPRIQTLFPNDQVVTVHEMGWDQLADGPLLLLAQDLFDILITIDCGLEFQQNLTRLKLAVIVVAVPKNQFVYYESAVSELRATLEEIQAGEVVHVDAKTIKTTKGRTTPHKE